MGQFCCFLVVDHDAGVRDVIRAQLEAMGQFVIACSSAAEARVVLARQRVRLLVADEALFGHGRELADHAWSLGVPTLLMSAYEEIKAELELGSRDFIGKPFRSGELSDHVTRALANRDDAASGG